MYSIVLMLAVSHNAAVPAWQHEEGLSVAKRYGDTGRFEYRHRRGGCCGGGGGCCGGSYGRGCSGGYYNGNGRAMPSTGSNGYYGAAVTQANDRATIVVHLPAEAKLMIDDEATKSTSEMRTFISPALEQGKKEFHYTLKAELTRDGKPMSQTKIITVRPGQTTEVNLDFAAADAGKAAEPKKDEKKAEPKQNSAQPKQDSGKTAEPKQNSGQSAQPKQDSGKAAEPKQSSDQPAEPKP